MHRNIRRATVITASKQVPLVDGSRAGRQGKVERSTRQKQRRSGSPVGLDESVKQKRQERAQSGSDQARHTSFKRRALALADKLGADQDRPEGCYLELLLPGLERLAKETRQQGRGKRRTDLRELVKAHSTYFTAALDIEFQEEWKESEERLQWDQKKLKELGYALFDLDAAPDGALYNDTVVRFSAARRALPFHTFTRGDAVLVSRGRPDEDSLEGVIVDIASGWVRVAFARSVAADVSGPGWRLDGFANTIAYERVRAALAAYPIEPPHTDAANPLRRLLYGDTQGLESLQAAAEVRPPFLHGPAGTAAKSAIKRGLAASSSSLNPSQLAAMRLAATSTLTLWQGPPGTGKTRTIVHYVSMMRTVLPARSGILVTAASNVAVDNLVSGLLALNVRVVRVGHPGKVAEALRHVTLDALAQDHPKGKQAAKMRQEAAGMSGVAQANAFHRAEELEKEAMAAVLDAAEVVACTCVGAGSTPMEERKYAVVVLDEATQATEPDSLVAVLKDVQSLLLVGDQQQLPPTVRALEAQRLGMGTSLFVRLMAMGVKPHLLDTQYRMHPVLAEFSAAAFYNDALLNGVQADQRPPVASFPWPNARAPVVFINCRGAEERAGAESPVTASPGQASSLGTSFRNLAEVEVVKQVVAVLLKDRSLTGGPADIGVISGYSAQVKEIALALAHKASKTSKRGPHDVVEVSTVDGFQGREKEVIVVSTVRSNAAGSIGFLADQRRLNVAFTRAKRGLVVVGNAETLRSHPLWRAWLGWLGTRPRLLIDVEELSKRL